MMSEKEVVDEIKDILDSYGIRYKQEAPLPDRQRIDLYLLDANIGLECKGLNKQDRKNERAKKQIFNYKKHLNEVWLILPNRRSLGHHEDFADKTLTKDEFYKEIPGILYKINNY